MKEEKHYLDTLQIRFIDKMIRKIDGGWDIYGETSLEALTSIKEKTYYTPSQKSWLMSMRLDYITSFCI